MRFCVKVGSFFVKKNWWRRSIRIGMHHIRSRFLSVFILNILMKIKGKDWSEFSFIKIFKRGWDKLVFFFFEKDSSKKERKD